VPGPRLTSCKVLVAAALAAFLTAFAGAQQLEVTAFAGLRLGGEFEDGTTGATRWLDEGASFGLMLGHQLGNDRTFEVMWDHQEGSVAADTAGEPPIGIDLDAFTLGGTFEWPREHTRPFVSGTVGLMLLSPETAGYDRDVLLALTLGGGVKVPISPRVTLRFEGRGIATLAVGGTAGVCGGGGCALSISGSGIGQLELLAGLTWAP
jgi:hypothetical protein